HGVTGWAAFASPAGARRARGRREPRGAAAGPGSSWRSTTDRAGVPEAGGRFGLSTRSGAPGSASRGRSTRPGLSLSDGGDAGTSAARGRTRAIEPRSEAAPRSGAAVAVSAALGGLSPGIVATLAAVVLARAIDHAPPVASALFALEGALISVVIIRLKAATEEYIQEVEAAETRIRELKALERHGRAIDIACERLERVPSDY